MNISSKCSEVTLDAFIDCLLNGNLQRLAKTEATEAELQAAWEQLYTEYCEMSGDRQHVYYFTLYRAMYYLKLKLHLAQSLLLLENPEQLEQLGYKGGAKQIIAKIKFDTVNLQAKEKELTKLTDKQTGTIKESDFDDWIVSVGKYLGYQIRRKEMLLSEFLSANKAMIRENEVKRKRIKV
ncbi:MAG: hypothetical protein LBS69_10595 [Prevotellaceae bacterium]|nr:hypothetical protein [Prevotellaceae bacterium]